MGGYVWIMNRFAFAFPDRGLSAIFGALLLLLLLNPLNNGHSASIQRIADIFISSIVSFGLIPWQYWAAFALALGLVWLWRDARIVKEFIGRIVGKKVAQVMAGWGFWASTSWAFDNLLYPAAIAWLGLLTGAAVMTVTAMAITFFMLLGYERGKVDWLGMEAIDEVREKGLVWVREWEQKRHKNRIFALIAKALLFVPKEVFKLFAWMLDKGGALAFIVLSIQMDPFITTAYFRRGRFDGLGKKDWMIFFGSGLLSNVYWSLRSFGVVIVVQYLWEFIR
jgi:hypothetical protein